MLSKLNRKSTNIPQQRPVKVLQFGEGNFLRAFADWMIDILNEKTNFNGAVRIVQPLPNGMCPVLNEQDGLYHVVLTGIRDGKPLRETRLITCVESGVNPYADTDAFFDSALNPDLEFIISNTTEAGIAFDANDRDPSKLATSFPGKLTQLLYRRYQHFNGSPDKGLILLPCELIEKNGENLRETIVRYIGHWNLPGAFAKWVMENNIFCNTLVDRIVPGYPKDTINEILEETGFDDKLVVTAETFHLWVIEPLGEKNFERVKQSFPVEAAGLQVKFVTDLTPYRTRKVRILNGAHTSLVPVAYLCGLRSVREAIEDPAVGAFIHNSIYREIIPTLDLPESELRQFAGDVIERFKNPFIRHELITIALNSISKYKVRVLPSVLTYIERRRTLPEHLLISLAALIRFYKGEWNGERIPLNDTPEILEFFRKAWESNDVEQVTQQVLSNKAFWDQDLTQVEGLASFISRQLTGMDEEKVISIP